MEKREKVVEKFKACILVLREQGDSFKEDDPFFKRWQEKAQEVTEELKKFSKEDQEWFKETWSEWIEENFSKELEEVRLKFD